MGNDTYRQNEVVINIKETIWDMLEQWKAILLVALAMALIVSGAKYYKDLNVFIEAEKAANASAEETYSSLDEHTNAILSELSEEDREKIQLILQQEAWLDNQRDYFNNSLVLSTDPNAQRQLNISYYIYDVENNAYSAINRSYINHLKEDDFLNAVKKHINALTDYKYIKELISGSCTSTEGKDSPGEILTVNIVLPETADAAAIEAEITNLLENYSKDLSEKIASHNIKFVESNDITVVNESASNRRTSIINSINSLNTIISNNKNGMNAEQRDAYERIQSAKDRYEDKSEEEEEEEIVAEAPPQPSISAKHVVLGLILGIAAYALAYLLWMVMRGRVNHASDLESYVGGRLLGEVYKPSEKSRRNSLIKSKFVEKFRYRETDNYDKQLEKVIHSIVTSCRHSGVKEAVNLIICQNNSDLMESTNNSGIEIKSIDAESISEESFLEFKDAIITAGKKTKLSDLDRLIRLCNYYDVNVLGSVFVGEQ